MATAIMSFPRRQRQATYGKASRKPSTFFPTETLSETTLNSPPTAIHSPVRLKRPQKPPPQRDSAIFDVPSSDDEKDNTQALENRRAAKTEDFGSSLPQRPAPKQPNQTRSISPADSSTSLSTTMSRKRKRKAPIIDISDEPSSSAIEDQIKMQLYQEHEQWSPNQLPTDTLYPVTKQPPRKRPAKIEHQGIQAFEITSSGSSTPQLPPYQDEELLPSTPPRQASPTGTASSSHSRGTITPRQARLWDTLLRAGEQQSPTKLSRTTNIDTLSLHSATKPKIASGLNPKMPRRKLVDALSRPTSKYASEEEDVEEAEETLIPEEGHLKPIELAEQAPSQPAQSAGPNSQQSIMIDGGPKVTYAQQRSHLEDSMLDFEASLKQPLDLDPPSVNLKYSSNLNSSLNLGEDDDEQTAGGMKSIYELRASGDNKRFKDEMDILLENFQAGSTISRKRSAMMELVKKLTDENYATRFSESGYAVKVFQSCRDEEDPILGSAISVNVAFILNFNVHAHTASHFYATGILEYLTRLLNFNKSLLTIAKERRTNMSKIAQGALVAFSDFIIESSVLVIDPAEDISPMLLALAGVDSLVRRLREAGNTDAILTKALLLPLLQIVSQSLQSKHKHSRALEMALSILESSTIATAFASDQAPWTHEDLRQLVPLFEYALKAPKPAMRPLALRLLLNLTNNNEASCTAFAVPLLICQLIALVLDDFELVSKDLEEEARLKTIDDLVLSLGAMINLAESSDEARKLTADAGPSSLDRLVEIFVKSRDKVSSADSEAESQSNVAFGYLAVLLGNLCQSYDVRNKIVAKLPRSRLNILIDVIEEFTAHHKKVDTMMADDSNGDGVWVVFTQRLQHVADLLKTQENV